MKINVNIDCTPSEARAFFGLPDVAPVNEMIVDAIVERTKKNIDTLSDPKLFWERALAAWAWKRCRICLRRRCAARTAAKAKVEPCLASSPIWPYNASVRA